MFRTWRDGVCGWSGEGERPAGLCSFFLAKWGGRPVLLEKDMFRVRVLFVLPPKCAKLSPLLCMCWKPLFIGKKMARFPNFVPQLLSFFFFVNLILLIFFGFFL
jgi:hypothetical protein